MKKIRLLLFVCGIVLIAPNLQAEVSRDLAKRVYDRLAGGVTDNQKISEMENQESLEEAIDIVLEEPSFYNVTLKNYFTPMTNVDHSMFEPLNDFSATAIGIVRDNLDFRSILYGDIIYHDPQVGNEHKYSSQSNVHYRYLEDNDIDLKSRLVKSNQSDLTGLPYSAIAGIISTRAFGKAYFSAGTNRRGWEYIAQNFLCKEMSELKDLTLPGDRIRQDVDRNQTSQFLNSCYGCHSGMDGVTGAFAYYHYEDNMLQYTNGKVQPKMILNSFNFPDGHSTQDDSWINYWRTGNNANLGWDTSDGMKYGKGTGAASLGREVSHSREFARCQVEQIYKYVCIKDPSSNDELAAIDNITDQFISSGYNLKSIFKNVAVYCLSE